MPSFHPRTLIVAVGICLGFALSCSQSTPEVLRIAAASSLGDVLPPLLSEYETQTGQRVEMTFGGSGELATQLRYGAPIDLLFLASVSSFSPLRSEDLIQGELILGLQNRLLWVGGPGATSGSSLTPIAIGAPSVPAGDYARLWLAAESQLWEDHFSKLEKPIRWVEFPHVRSVLAAIESGACGSGFLYATDWKLSPSLPILAESNQIDGRVDYALGVAKRSSQSGRALSCAQWLLEQEDAWLAAGFELKR